MTTQNTVYLNQRIAKATVERLRKYEKKNKLKPSITKTINHILNQCTSQK